jgi:hypothetical protein
MQKAFELFHSIVDLLSERLSFCPTACNVPGAFLPLGCLSRDVRSPLLPLSLTNLSLPLALIISSARRPTRHIAPPINRRMRSAMVNGQSGLRLPKTDMAVET